MGKVIFDCDPGLDDAIALLVLCQSDLEILGVTTVAGNHRVDLTTRNALDLLALYGREDIPVAQGAGRPLINDLHIADFVHGPNGLGQVVLPRAARAPEAVHAVEWMRQTLLESEDKVTLIAIGPLTNLGLLLRMYPEVKEKIELISIMGGSTSFGNISPVAEANVGHDPEAAKIVFSSGLPIVMSGLNLTFKMFIRDEEIQAIEAMGTTVSDAAAKFLFYHAAFAKRMGLEVDQMHDTCAVAAVLYPELFTGRRARVDLDTGYGPGRGQTIADFRAPNEEANVLILEDGDREALIQRVKEAAGGCVQDLCQ
jgi:pyrimidine-specific ribonucleoside hydrolase